MENVVVGEASEDKIGEVALGNPRYCSYVEGLYTYKDPNTSNEYTWDEEKKLWTPKSVEIYFDGVHYVYNEKEGQVMYWDKDKMSWLLKNAEQGDTGYSNPNYDSSNQQPRRFYYASLSPTNMGVNSEPVFLSPDDQVNNNNVVEEETEELPLGWERHEDSSGAYYWHIKSGTIQREVPKPSLLIPGKSLDSQFVRRSTSTFSDLSSHLANVSLKAEKRKSWSEFLNERQESASALSSLNSSSTSSTTSETKVLNPSGSGIGGSNESQCLKFIGVSLGSLSISEEDLTPEKSSRAVSRVISELTMGSKTGMEVAGKIWGGGSELYLELDESNLRVKTMKSNLIVAEQPIHSIRVWGVGRDDPRDFAYVAREKSTRVFLCHVFRLELNARPLAAALRDACKKIMIERQKKMKRPTSLPMKKASVNNLINFPTPMDEPRKVIKAYYLGGTVVTRPTGIETLNSAIDSVKNNHPIPVTVSVAPSVLEIKSESGDINIEIRVRYLSFMGIGRDVTTCGLVVHTARDDFEAHCFYSTPSSGALCKAIEAACVLRYQKCLDARHHHSGSDCDMKSPKTPNGSSKAAAIASTFKSVLGRFTSIDKS